MKVLIIAPSYLPVPPVRGGAIEGLIDLIVRQNEINNQINLSVVSVYDKLAYKEAGKYQNTTFYWIKMKSIRKVLHNRFYYYIGQKLFKRPFVEFWHSQVIRILQTNEFDKIVLEESVRSVGWFGNRIRKDSFYFHTHYNNSYNLGDLDACCKVITVSDYLKSCVAERSGKSLEDIKVVLNSIDETLFEFNASARERFRQQYSLSKDCVAFCFAGRIVEEKGVRELIEAFIRFSRSEHLFIIGKVDNPYAYKMVELSADYKDRIHFVGFIRNNQLSEFLSAMDVAVTPSICDDVCAVVNIEYQAMGLPLITTDRGGIKEFVSKEAILVDGHEDVIPELAEAMAFLSLNAKQRELISLSGKEFVRKFKIKGYYKNFVECLK